MAMKTFDLSKYARLNIGSVVIRQTTGHDEDKAADIAKAKGLTGDLNEELIRLAVVSYDGTPATFPFTDFDAWNKRTRDMVARCFNQLNGTKGVKGIEAALNEQLDGDAYRFDLAAVAGCSIKSITLREVTGKDEDEAIRRSIANKSSMMLELFQLSIVQVDGQPFHGSAKDWNSRTLSIVMGGYRKLNDASLDEEPQAQD